MGARSSLGCWVAGTRAQHACCILVVPLACWLPAVPRLCPSPTLPLLSLRPCCALNQAVTLHNTLCRHLGECSYPPRREVQLFLLHSRQRGALLAPVNATLARCVTGWPPVYRDDSRLERKVCLCAAPTAA